MRMPTEPEMLLGAAAFLGAILADLLALAAALRSGRVLPSRWRRSSTYLGTLLQGCIAAVLQILAFRVTNPIAALSLGFNLPLIVEKVASILPPLNPPSVPERTGLAGQLSEMRGSEAAEALRRFLAKDEK